jgi:hypothetical protein
MTILWKQSRSEAAKVGKAGAKRGRGPSPKLEALVKRKDPVQMEKCQSTKG